MRSSARSDKVGGGGGGGGELLQELEALSQALYKAQIVPTAATSPRREFNHLGHRRRASEASQGTRPKQARALDSRHSISEIVIKKPIEDSAAHDHDFDWNEEEVQEEIDLSQKKKSGFWNWKPVRALAHIGQQRFHCEFSAHIHGIEKLPPSINGLRLQVHLRHRETGVQTVPARVSHSCVEFEEVLHFRCTIYGSKRSSGGVKYMSKSFTLSVVAVDADELEFGKQQLDLSRILPSNPVPNPQDSNSSWNTSFKLTGKAKGGSLWITFGYEILDGSGSSKQGTGGSSGTSPGIRSGGAVSRSFNSLPSSPRTGSMFGGSKIIKSGSAAGVMDFGSPAMSEPANDFGGTMESFNLDDEEKEAPPAARSMRGGVKQQQQQQQQQQQLGLPPLPSKHSKAIDVVEHRGKPLFAETDREIAPGTPGRSQEKSEAEEDAAADDAAVEFNVVEQGVETSTLDEEILALSEEREAVKNSESQDQKEEEQEQEQKDEDDAKEELEAALKDAKGDNEEAEEKVQEPEEVRVEEVEEFDWKRELEEDDQFDNLGNPSLLTSATSASSAALAAEKEYWRQEEELQLMQLKQDSYGLDYGEGAKTELLKVDEEDDELVTDEFLDMLGGSTAAPVAADDARGAAKEYIVDSDDGIENEQDSPRALLLKQFEQEAMEGGFGLDIDEAEAQLSFGSPIVPDFRLEEDVLDADNETFQQRQQQQQKSEEDWSSDEDKELAAIMDAAESELQKATQAMKSKARAKMLEDAEAEALLNKWGLDEQVFKDDESSVAAAAAVQEQALSSSSDIVVRQGLPSLAPGLGTSVPTADGGSLRSMDPSHFENGKKNDGKLVMHVSKPVVVPAEMGSTALDVLRNFAAAGTETMATEAMAAMPLQDITGKSVQQIALEGEVCFEENNRRYNAALLGYGENRLALEGGETDGDHLELSTSSSSSSRALYQSKPRKQRKARQQQSEFLQLDELAPVAMEKIEELALQGLKIQCDMADEDAPYTLDPAQNRSPLKGSSSSNNLSLLEGDASDGMISMSLSLDEWMRLDAGIAEEEEVSENTKAIMASHKAAHTTTDLVLNLSGDHKGQSSSGSSDDGSGSGKMGNTLTLAMLVQLRDPLRNYEPVGAPMMALVEAERVMIPPRPKLWKRVGLKGNSEADFNEDDQEDKGGVQPQFRITGVHMAGLNADEDLKDSSKKRQQQQLWGNQRQQQSGSRWLVANGMGKTGGAKHPLLKSSKNKSSAGEASLWSVSSRPLDSSAAAKSSLTRNPDVKFGKTSAFGGFRKR